jgi:membrane protease YdiL (CAAX protease family)
MTRLPAGLARSSPPGADAPVPDPPVPWRGRDLAAVAGMAALWAFVVLPAVVLVLTVVGVVPGLDGLEFASPHGAAILLVNGTVPVLVTYGYLALRFRPEHRLLWRPGGARAPGWLPALAIGLAIGLVWWALVDVLAFSLLTNALEYEPPVQQQLIEALSAGGWAAAAAVLAIVAIAPLGEELVFRGVVFLGLIRWLGPLGAALISSAVFGLIHIQTDLGAFVFLAGYAFAFGLFACWLVRRSGSLWLAIGAHALSNAASVALALLTGEV